MNQDGEGVGSVQKYARKRLVMMGVEEPNEEEKAQMEQAQQQPDPTQQIAAAKTADLAASAQLKDAKAGEAKASTVLKVAQAEALVDQRQNRLFPMDWKPRTSCRHRQEDRRGRAYPHPDRSFARATGN
jgi:hypothetical protein